MQWTSACTVRKLPCPYSTRVRTWPRSQFAGAGTEDSWETRVQSHCLSIQMDAWLARMRATGVCHHTARDAINTLRRIRIRPQN